MRQPCNQTLESWRQRVLVRSYLLLLKDGLCAGFFIHAIPRLGDNDAISQYQGRLGSESQYLLPAITLGSGIIRLDNAPVSSDSTQTHDLYNLSENLILYSTSSAAPNTLAPASICSYSEKTGRGFSNASDDLAAYFDATTGKSTGNTVSIIQVTAAPQLYQSPGVVVSFAGLLRNMDYAGAMPSA
jgi:hypothetical protein